MAAVGFLGAMITVYDDAGGTYQIDEPDTWNQYLNSRWKDDWTQALIKEVTKLEDLGTWVKVPISWAKGHRIHRVKELFKAKLDENKKLDRRKVRVVVVGTGYQQSVDYLEHFTSGISLGALRMLKIKIREDGWISFHFDITNAFPHEDIERKTFMHLPRGPFNNKDPVTGEQLVGYLQKNLYGTPPAPRTFSKGAHKYHLRIGFSACVVENTLYAREDNVGNKVENGMYVDEGYGGATTMDKALWYKARLEEKWAITWEFEWKNMLGFGVEDIEDKPLAFTANKYVRSMMDKFLPGELSQERKTASRESIMHLSAIELPPLGSPEDITMRAMQSENRALTGALGHLARGRFDICFDHALTAQTMARGPYEAREANREILRYANSRPMRIEFPSTVGKKPYRPAPSLYREPIRPYDEDIDYDLFGIGDLGMRRQDIAKSKPMGGFAVMYGGGPLEAKSYRVHTVITESTSGETVVASRLGNRLVFYRRILTFLDRSPQGPSPLFTDNDGTWYVARDATNATRMTYVINHVRMLQQLEEDGETRAFQVDGALNPADCLATWREPALRARHYAFLMGNPAKARQLWVASTEYKNYKPKKIYAVPVPPAAIEASKSSES